MSILKSMVKPRTITVATPQPVEDSYDKNSMQIAKNKWIRACIDDLEKPLYNIRGRDNNDRILSWEFHDWDDEYYSGPVCTVDFRNGLPDACGVLSYDELLSYNQGGVYYVHFTEPEDQLILAVDRHTDVLSIVPDPDNGERIPLLNLDNPAALDALIRSLMVIRSTII